jgi:hypothetical protein
MTDDERLQRVASLTTRRAAAGPIMNVRADRLTRVLMTASCAVSVAGAGALIANRHVVPATVTKQPAGDQPMRIDDSLPPLATLDGGRGGGESRVGPQESESGVATEPIGERSEISPGSSGDPGTTSVDPVDASSDTEVDAITGGS